MPLTAICLFCPRNSCSVRSRVDDHFTVSVNGNVVCTEPPVAVTVRVDVPAGVPDGAPVLGVPVFELLVLAFGETADVPHPRQAIKSKITTAKLGFRNRFPGSAKISRARISIVNSAIHSPNGGGKCSPGRGSLDRTVVATVTVTCAAVFPFIDTDPGETVQVAAWGAPLQVRLTLPLNAVGTTERVKLAV